jgi:hypothetical protein
MGLMGFHGIDAYFAAFQGFLMDLKVIHNTGNLNLRPQS